MPQLRAHAPRATPASRSEPTRSDGAPRGEWRIHAPPCFALRVFTDDTGWRINSESAYMMGFDTDEASVYQIRLRHRHQGVRELIPSDYGGVMHTDRSLTYDAWALELVAQQKC